ncbi:hypothetical protein QCA50_016197 [Cerrena zonata]|uniref:Uncharacterized protein n=1 Tax=Cerrena zonata TaxID=2478898 RepID=A0AAW0FL52_9APHY
MNLMSLALPFFWEREKSTAYCGCVHRLRGHPRSLNTYYINIHLLLANRTHFSLTPRVYSMGAIISRCLFIYYHLVPHRARLLPTTDMILSVFQYELFPERSTSEYLKRLCEEPSNFTRLHRRDDELARCKVTHLELYKCTEGSLHEFVLAHIVHYSCDPYYDRIQIQKRVVRVERAVCEPSRANDDTNSSTKDIITIYESSKKALEVGDSKAKCCYVVKFSRPYRVTIFELAVVADTLHLIAPNNTPFKYMDYWFANNFCRLLAAPTTTYDSSSYIVVQKYSRRNFRVGYFKDIPVLDGDSRVVIRDDLQVSVDDFRELISQNPDVFSQGPLSGDQPALNPTPYDPKHTSQFAKSDIFARPYQTRRNEAVSDITDAYLNNQWGIETSRRAKKERVKKMEKEEAARAESKDKVADESGGAN